MESPRSATSNAVSDSQPLSVRVVTAVADLEGIDPTELDVPLYDVVNPEALDQLFEPRNGARRGGVVEFTYYGYNVVVESDDRDGGVSIAVQDRDDLGSAAQNTSVSTTASPPATTHYCLDCEWSLANDDEYSTTQRSERAIDHHLETGHTIESNQSSTETDRDNAHNRAKTDEPIVKN